MHYLYDSIFPKDLLALKEQLEGAHQLEVEKERASYVEAHRLEVQALQTKVGVAWEGRMCSSMCTSTNSLRKPLKQGRQS